MRLRSQVSCLTCSHWNHGVISRQFLAHISFPSTDQARKNEELLEIVAGEKLRQVPYRRGATEDIIEETQKQASASLSQSRLPQSPLTDPRLTAARRGHKALKAEPTPFKQLSQPRRNLAKNPYAQALATPLRQCTLTGARVPKAFLMQFGLVTDPRTGKHWHIPKPFIGRPKGPKQDASAALESNPEMEDEGEHNGEKNRRQFRTKSSLQILCSQRALKITTGRFKQKSRKVIPHIWFERNNLSVDSLVWRQDMPDFVLNRMREQLSHHLTYMKSSSPDLFERVAGWDLIEKYNIVGALMWFPSRQQMAAMERTNVRDSPEGESLADESIQSTSKDNVKEQTAVKEQRREQDHEPDELLPGEETSAEEPSSSISDTISLAGEDEDSVPPAYAVAWWKGRRVAVFNMPLLFGRQLSSELQNVFDFEAEAGGLVSIRSKRRTGELLLKMWTLMGYLAEGESIQWDGT